MFDEILEKNTKGIQDLLHHELSAFALAHIIATSSQPEVLLQEVENMLYKRVVTIVQDVFEAILAEMDLEQALTQDTENMRATIQTFVNEQVKLACKDLKEKAKWWRSRVRE